MTTKGFAAGERKKDNSLWKIDKQDPGRGAEGGVQRSLR